MCVQREHGVLFSAVQETCFCSSYASARRVRHASLKRQKDYKKRVTWFSSSSDPDISKVVLVEYIGELKQMEDIHGNSKRESAAYKRTHPDVIDKASHDFLEKKPSQMYTEMVLKDEAKAPQSMQQLRAQKHRKDQKNNYYSGNNIADEVLEVLKM
jgi:hypothetical protein